MIQASHGETALLEEISPQATVVTPPKGRPTADRVCEINLAILEAATKCFLAHGYERASMDAIATAARISKVTLYARYQKDSLFQAVVQDRLATWWAEEFKQNCKPDNTLEQRLRAHVRILMALGASEELRAFDRLLSTAPPKLTQSLQHVRYNHMIDVITGEIEEFTRTSGNPARNPRRIASDLLALLAGWFRMESMVGAVSQSEAIAFGDRAVDLILAARSVW
jgi:AcrR family transcriptional regulator